MQYYLILSLPLLLSIHLHGQNDPVKNSNQEQKAGYMVIEQMVIDSTTGPQGRNYTDFKFKIDDGPFRTIGKRGVFLKKYYSGNDLALKHLQKYRNKRTIGKNAFWAAPVMGLGLFVFGGRITGTDKIVNPVSIGGIGLSIGGVISGTIILKSSQRDLFKSVESYNQALE